jgi:hypothetical protein
MNGRGGKIDVSCYVALGDSLAAGYVDGALCYSGQLNSYPNLIASQFKMIGGGEFRQPLIDPASVGMGFSGNSCMVLRSFPGGTEPNLATLSYLASRGDASVFFKNEYDRTGPYNNFGLPGVKATALLASGLGDPQKGPGYYNPFFTRMTSDPVTASVLSDALLLKPTFFSLFIGNNDALSFALTGGTMDSITPPFGPPGHGFEGSIAAIINELTAIGAKGVIANIPDITSVPFFVSLPYNGLLLDANEARELNTKYAAFNITLVPGKNPFVVSVNENVIRKAEKGEMILSEIVLDNLRESYLSGKEPIPKKYVLTAPEISKIQSTIKEYNSILEQLAKDNGLAFVDVNTLLKSSRPNMIYKCASRNFIYSAKGVYSLDGLHPNALGQAVLANEFIKAINRTYGSEVPLISGMDQRKKILSRQ